MNEFGGRGILPLKFFPSLELLSLELLALVALDAFEETEGPGSKTDLRPSGSLKGWI